MSLLEIRTAPLLPEHYPRVAEIFKEGMETHIATFRREVPTWKEWDEGHIAAGRLVALLGEEVIGWVALSPAFPLREAYRGVVENSIYIARAHAGKGVGKLLLTAMLEQVWQAGYWSVEARILRENAPSIALHKACGFRMVGVRERLGRMQATGKWHDVVFMEYRSTVNGAE